MASNYAVIILVIFWHTKKSILKVLNILGCDVKQVIMENAPFWLVTAFLRASILNIQYWLFVLLYREILRLISQTRAYEVCILTEGSYFEVRVTNSLYYIY